MKRCTLAMVSIFGVAAWAGVWALLAAHPTVAGFCLGFDLGMATLAIGGEA